MPIKLKQGCRTCLVIRSEAKNSQWKLSRMYKLIDLYHLKGTTLKAVQAEYPDITYLAIRNHAIKHQNPSEKMLITNANNRAKIEKRNNDIQAMKHHSTRRTTALEKLEQMMDEGELKGATFTAMATLLKQEADIEEKQKDRSLELFKMLAKFQSGELERTNGPSLTRTTPDRLN